MVIVNEICEEQRKDSLYMNIIKNELNEIVGRINLFPIKHEKYNRAFELGYRISEKHQGKGYATESVNKLINIAFNEYAIECIQALTSPKNVASQIVLTKNGFSYVTRLKNDVEVNGIFEDSVVFEKIQQIEHTLNRGTILKK